MVITIFPDLERCLQVNINKEVKNMSWSYMKVGRAGALAQVVKQQVADTRGCPEGSAEEAAKNQIGEVLETLCSSLPVDKVVRINVVGSASIQNGQAMSQNLKLEFDSVYDFVE